jgi:hypothetical protein
MVMLFRACMNIEKANQASIQEGRIGAKENQSRFCRGLQGGSIPQMQQQCVGAIRSQIYANASSDDGGGRCPWLSGAGANASKAGEEENLHLEILADLERLLAPARR